MKKQTQSAQRLLKDIKTGVYAGRKHDWWDDLSDQAKASIKHGLKDIADKKLTSHAEVMKEYRKFL